MEKEEIIKTAQELIKIPSENPSGNEEKCADYVEAFFKNAGIETIRKIVQDKRPNIVAKLRGDLNKPLVFLVHMDTVPAGENWTVDPFGGEVKQGNLYGRGAVDMKGSLAAAMHLITEISKMKLKPKRDFLVCATVDEENQMRGVQNLIDEGIISKQALVLALEPTDLMLAVATKGVLWYEVTVKGKSAHAANPWEGADAIDTMILFVNKLRDMVKNLNYDDPLLGKPQVTVGKIVGGEKINIISSLCKAEIDFRIVPPFGWDDTNAMVNTALKEACNATPGTSGSMKELSWPRLPVFAKTDSIMVKSLENSYLNITGKQLDRFGLLGYTDAAVVGIKTDNPDCLIFGPGSLSKAHTIDEFIPIEDIYCCYDILLSSAVDLLTREDEGG